MAVGVSNYKKRTGKRRARGKSRVRLNFTAELTSTDGEVRYLSDSVKMRCRVKRAR